MPEIAGVRLATGAAGIKYQGRTDVLLALFDKGTTVAGVLTRSKCPSAPVEWCRAKLKGGKARALVVNSGNANAFTGKTGREATAFTAKLAAQGRRLQAGGGLSRLDRRDRRAAAGAARSTACWTGSAAKRRARALPRCREGDHDHRHVSQGRDRAARSSATRR